MTEDIRRPFLKALASSVGSTRGQLTKFKSGVPLKMADIHDPRKWQYPQGADVLAISLSGAVTSSQYVGGVA